MSKHPAVPVALTIAGSDSGGGAGLQADLKVFAALGVHGACAITCLTAQNPRRIPGVESASPRMVRQQLEAVFESLPPRAAKTGMLHDAEIVRVVARIFAIPGRPPLVVDPVMVATSGRRLLKKSALTDLQQRLLPLATLITPNLAEAEVLAETRLRDLEDLRRAARILCSRFGCAVLVKGGHLRGSREAADIFFDGRTELLLSAPFAPGLATHGTGCVYSAAITGYLARGHDLPESVQLGKHLVTQAIHHGVTASGHHVLNPFPRGSHAGRDSGRPLVLFTSARV